MLETVKGFLLRVMKPLLLAFWKERCDSFPQSTGCALRTFLIMVFIFYSRAHQMALATISNQYICLSYFSVHVVTY